MVDEKLLVIYRFGFIENYGNIINSSL